MQETIGLLETDMLVEFDDHILDSEYIDDEAEVASPDNEIADSYRCAVETDRGLARIRELEQVQRTKDEELRREEMAKLRAELRMISDD